MVTAIILAKNEEKNIVDCLENLSFCNEILVIDDNSQDRTVEIAKSLGAKVFRHSLNNDFSKQRNYGLNKAKNSWVLFIDADERVRHDLADEVMSKISEDKNDGFFIKREDIIWGKRMLHGELGNIWLIRLAKKGAGIWKGVVHEKWDVSGNLSNLENKLDHYPHQNVSDFLKEIDYYTDLRSQELNSAGTISKWYSILLYPKAKFVVNYIIKLGFLDGIAGLIFAVMMSYHSFLVRAKLWILNQKQ